MNKPISRALILICALFLAACAGPGGTSIPWSTSRQIQIEALPGANQGNATELDIVFVSTQSALTALPRTGPEWFRSRAALSAALGPDITVVSLQVPSPSAPFTAASPKLHGKPVAVLSYANYLDAEGQPVGDLTPHKCVRITLAPSTVTYAECNGGAEVKRDVYVSGQPFDQRQSRYKKVCAWSAMAVGRACGA